VTIEYHWLEAQYGRLPALVADLVRRRAAVIATPANSPGTLAAKAATTTIPIVFGVGEDPVRLGLVASLARPGGNLTGINLFNAEVAAKGLRLLHDLVPKAVRIAVLVNPANAGTAEPTLRNVRESGHGADLMRCPRRFGFDAAILFSDILVVPYCRILCDMMQHSQGGNHVGSQTGMDYAEG